MNLPIITAEQFDTIINENQETCVVVFSKESCSVCKELAPFMEKVAKDYENDASVNFYSINVTDPEGLALFKRLKLIGVPQSVFFLNGEQKEAIPGAISESIIRKEVGYLLNPDSNTGLMGKIKSFFKK